MTQVAEDLMECDKAFVYFLKHKTKPIIKIGKAKDWQNRVDSLGGEGVIDYESSFLKEMDTEKDAFDLEYTLHQVFKDSQVVLEESSDGYTEWFCSSISNEISRIVKDCKSLSGRKRKCKIVEWGGVKINVETCSFKELSQFVHRNCEVSFIENKITITPKGNGFRYKMGPILKRLQSDLKSVDSYTPTGVNFHKNSWILYFDDSSLNNVILFMNAK